MEQGRPYTRLQIASQRWATLPWPPAVWQDWATIGAMLIATRFDEVTLIALLRRWRGRIPPAAEEQDGGLFGTAGRSP